MQGSASKFSFDKNWIFNKKISNTRKAWIFISRLCTLFIPDLIISYFLTLSMYPSTEKYTPQRIQAWREKVTLCILVALLSLILLFYLWFFGAFLCPTCKLLSMSDFKNFDIEHDPHVIIYGRIFDLKKLALLSTSQKGYNLLSFYAGRDASELFTQEVFNKAMSDIGTISIKYPSLVYDQQQVTSLLLPSQLSSSLLSSAPLVIQPQRTNLNLPQVPNDIVNFSKAQEQKRSIQCGYVLPMVLQNEPKIENRDFVISNPSLYNEYFIESSVASNSRLQANPSPLKSNLFREDNLLSEFTSIKPDFNLSPMAASQFGINSIADIDLELSSTPFAAESAELKALLEALSNCWVADVGWSTDDLIFKGSSKSSAVIQIDGMLFNISSLLHLRQNKKGAFEHAESRLFSNQFLSALTSLPWSGSDHTPQILHSIDGEKNIYSDYFDNVENIASYLAAKIIPVVGVVDPRSPVKCAIGRYALITSAVVMLLVTGVKFLAALQLGRKKEPEVLGRHTILQITCFTEGEVSLRKAIDSLASCNYDDAYKLLWIVCDGIATGQGNDRPTARILMDILGIHSTVSDDKLFSLSKRNDLPPLLAYDSLAQTHSSSTNYARVWAGHYFFYNDPVTKIFQRSVPFVLIIKLGTPLEYQASTKPPGNRGKRDSQLILLRWLSKFLYTNVHQYQFDPSTKKMNSSLLDQFSSLEMTLTTLLTNYLNLDPLSFEYLLMVDADTECAPDALTRLVSTMLSDRRVIGVCGETILANPRVSWVTAIQVYEYYISHHLSKAFESLFGVVTCLPGCFSLFRLRGGTDMKPYLLSPLLLAEYGTQEGEGILSSMTTLHRRNLLTLGEDRYLTTLLLKYFPSCKTSFAGDAICKTIAPHSWKVLLSQRRRWINSTVHNLWELLSIPRLCGIGCLSLKFVVLLDLNSTLVMPATLVYLLWCIGKLILSLYVPDESAAVTNAAIMFALISFSMQACVFLLKRKWFIIGWMFLYLLSLPIFCFFLPLYAFWHFDDFSWGHTRKQSTKTKLPSDIFHDNESDQDRKDLLNLNSCLSSDDPVIGLDDKNSLLFGRNLEICPRDPKTNFSYSTSAAHDIVKSTTNHSPLRLFDQYPHENSLHFPNDLENGQTIRANVHPTTSDYYYNVLAPVSLSQENITEIENMLRIILSTSQADLLSLEDIRKLVEQKLFVDLTISKEWFSALIESTLTEIISADNCNLQKTG